MTAAEVAALNYRRMAQQLAREASECQGERPLHARRCRYNAQLALRAARAEQRQVSA